MVKEELCEKVVEVRRVNDSYDVVFEEDVLRLICEYAPQSGRSLEESALSNQHSDFSSTCFFHVLYSLFVFLPLTFNLKI